MSQLLLSELNLTNTFRTLYSRPELLHLIFMYTAGQQGLWSDWPVLVVIVSHPQSNSNNNNSTQERGAEQIQQLLVLTCGVVVQLCLLSWFQAENLHPKPPNATRTTTCTAVSTSALIFSRTDLSYYTFNSSTRKPLRWFFFST